MTDPHTSTGVRRFGPFEVDAPSGELRRDGARVPLQDLPFRLLLALLDRPQQVVVREELAKVLWGDGTFVDSVAGLNTAVAKLREALGDDADHPVYVETVPRRGYRFIGNLEAPARSGKRPPATLLAAAAICVIAIVAASWTLYRSGAPQKPRVAVVLFDNETGVPGRDALAQRLTDATVTVLGARRTVEVVGNASILRTERPFRSLERIRDEVRADFLVIGQLQTIDGALLIRAHLIRGADLAHVWVNSFPEVPGNEALLQANVSQAIDAAVGDALRAPR